MLGHSSISVTGDTYGHTSVNAARAAVEGLSGALGPVIPKEISIAVALPVRYIP